MSKASKITVYKASAGSGKTFTLAVEYISLLILQPLNYENILAVTFTNKATEEMKMRILSQLYGIWKQLPDSETYHAKVKEKTGKTDQEIIERAGLALHGLIHHYHEFQVKTIDAFFQTVLRNLARELDLSANFRVELNDTQVVETSVDTLIESLDENRQILDWIKQYIGKNIEEDLSWNVIGDIKQFGMNIFRDFYKKHAEEIQRLMDNGRFFERYMALLTHQRKAYQEHLSATARNMLERLQAAGFDDATYYKYGDKGTVLKYIRQAATLRRPSNDPLPARVRSFLEDPAKMIAKTPQQVELTTFAETVLVPLLKTYEQERAQAWYHYQSATLTLRHLNQLRLLHAIAEVADEINRSTNRFQLSNTQMLLNLLISDSDTPFVFEKIGTRLKHMMIDEFQDTSITQWKNFKSLMDNCLSQSGSSNLIVGDVKQSIYRWRAGDWKLLNNIESEFRSEQIQVESLDTNYRSEHNIVAFNNAFFSLAVEQTIAELHADNIPDSEQLAKAYQRDELIQKDNKQKCQGYVRIELFPSSAYRQNIMDQLLNTVDNLLEQGHTASGIAILMRNNSDIQDVAAMFMKERKNVKIVSDEAFRLDCSIVVNMIVMAMRVISQPDDMLTLSTLAKRYQTVVLGNNTDDRELLFHQDVERLLPEAFLTHREQLLSLPLADMVEDIEQRFELHRLTGQSAYLCAFHDYLQEYLLNNPADIDSFLKAWDKDLSGKTIQSDQTEGIRLISIHKSKGLEFDHVIIPFCDWQLEKNNVIWCEKKTIHPYDQLPVLPVDFSKTSMQNTVYETDYQEEHLQNVVDNMNLLYVAFTRASKSLIVMGKRMSANKKQNKKQDVTSTNRSEVVEACLTGLTHQLPGSILEGTDEEKAVLRFEWGTPPLPTNLQDHKTKFTDNVFTKPSIPHSFQVVSHQAPITFRQSNKSRDFVAGEEIDDHQTTYMKLGNILHHLFASIRTTDDINPILRQLELEGILYDDNLHPEQLRHKIAVALEHPVVKDWFDARWNVYNECTILTRNANGVVSEHRPDRVMTDGQRTIVVDFKFGAPRSEYHDQVRRYMNLLSRMNTGSVEGYLWYVLRNEVVPVSLTK